MGVFSKVREIRLPQAERVELEALVRTPAQKQRRALRAHIVLLPAEGCSWRAIAHELATMLRTVSPRPIQRFQPSVEAELALRPLRSSKVCNGRVPQESGYEYISRLRRATRPKGRQAAEDGFFATEAVVHWGHDKAS
ncbi:MAG: hypothetical protein ACREFO_17875 [Acetobacteraceae bacterium]